MEEVFRILGIEKTTDEKAIKQAYRTKLVKTNPEDDPEGFKQLRKAYEDACAYAKNPEAAAEAEKKDETPSGIWLDKAKHIYENIHTRQDEGLWEELFRDDTFISLEDEENCRIKLLTFLLSHFRLPTKVWKLLDKKLKIRNGAKELREHFPADFVHFLTMKCTRGEDLDFSLFEGNDDADYDQYMHDYDLCWNALQNQAYEDAKKALEDAGNLGIFHPAMGICRVHFLDRTGQTAEAESFLSELVEKYAADQIVQYNAADYYWRHDRKKEAAAIFERLKEDNQIHYMANLRLAEWYYETGEYKKAKKCADKVLRSGIDEGFFELLKKINHAIEAELEEQYEESGDIECGLELGWCYLQDGKVNRGIRLALGMDQKRIPAEKKAEYQGLLTKLFMESGDAEKVLELTVRWKELLEEKILAGEDDGEKARDRDRIRQCAFMRMHSFRILGSMYAQEKENKEHAKTAADFFQNALKEAEDAMSEDFFDMSVHYEKANIYLDMGEYERCIELCEEMITEHRWYAAYATQMEAYVKQQYYPGIVKTAKECIRYFPDFLRAYEHLGRIYLSLKMKKELIELAKDAEKRNLKSERLSIYRKLSERETMPDLSLLNGKIKSFRREYVQNAEKGLLFDFERGLEKINEIYGNYPFSFVLIERAHYYSAANRLKEAKNDLEEALLEEPFNPYILKGLSEVSRAEGDYEKALIYLQKAIRFQNEELHGVLREELFELYCFLGDYKNALLTCGKYIYEDKPGINVRQVIGYADALAWCNDVEKAAWVLQKLRSPKERYAETVKRYQWFGYHKQAKKLLEDWSREATIRPACMGQFGRFFLKRSVPKAYEEFQIYCQCAAWQEILFGELTKKGIQNVWKMLDIAAQNNENGLGDAIFFAILSGDEKRGRAFARKLKEFLNKESWKAEDRFAKKQKNYLWLKVLSVWYQEPGQAEKLLDSEKEKVVCEHCHLCRCRKLESLKLLLLLQKMHRGDAAKDREPDSVQKSGCDREALRKKISASLKEQPMNQYLQALKRFSES